MCCHSEIETQETEHRAAAEDCVSVHDTPPDGEVCVSTDGKDCWICCVRWFVQKKKKKNFTLWGLTAGHYKKHELLCITAYS